MIRHCRIASLRSAKGSRVSRCRLPPLLDGAARRTERMPVVNAKSSPEPAAMVGAAPHVFARLQPVFEPWTARVVHVEASATATG